MKNKTLCEMYGYVKSRYYKPDLVTERPVNEYRIALLSSVGVFATVMLSDEDTKKRDTIAQVGIDMLKLMLIYKPDEAMLIDMERHPTPDRILNEFSEMVNFLCSIEGANFLFAWRSLKAIAKQVGIDNLLLEMQRVFHNTDTLGMEDKE